MSRETKITGIIGEEIAANFLKSKGYKIVERNFRTTLGEIDVIARHNGVLVFVEVKTRLTQSLGPPFLSVTAKKENRLINNAFAYLQAHGLNDPYWRIDIVSVNLANYGGMQNIEHIENAVLER